MTILEALVQLRDDLKLWCINNFNNKLNKNLGTEEASKFLMTDSTGAISTTSISGGASTIISSDLTASMALVSDADGKVAASEVTAEELGYLSGIKRNLQVQLYEKAKLNHTHAISEVTDLQTTLDGKALSDHTHVISDVTDLQSSLDGKADKATTLAGYGITDGATISYVDEVLAGLSSDGTVDASVVQASLNAHTTDTSNPHRVALSQLGVTATATELNYVDGVTSSIQNQLNNKATASHTHAISDITNLQSSLDEKTSKTYVDDAVSNKANKHVSTTGSLSVSAWSSKSQTISVTGVTASNIVIVSPAPNSYVAYTTSNIRCTTQDAGALTFVCDNVPDSALTVNIVILS